MARRTPKCNNCGCCPPCPLQYNEETCEVVWTCEDADEVKFIQPDELEVDKTGTRSTDYNKKYQIRVTRFKDTPQECTADSNVVEPTTACCTERVCEFCDCYDASNTKGTLPAAEVQISGVIGRTTGDLGNEILNGFNGTFISAPCTDQIYYEENNLRWPGGWYSYLYHAVNVDYPVQLLDGSYWMRVYGIASNHNFTGSYNNYHNTFACWKPLPFSLYPYAKVLDTSCPPVSPPTFDCWSCEEWASSHNLNVRHIKENTPLAWTLDPNYPTLSQPHTQSPFSCDFRNISVNIFFL